VEEVEEGKNALAILIGEIVVGVFFGLLVIFAIIAELVDAVAFLSFVPQVVYLVGLAALLLGAFVCVFLHPTQLVS